jgi:hypothetical protein
MIDYIDYKDCSLWETAFSANEPDRHKSQREYFRQQFELLRQKVTYLVQQIPKDIPGLSIHDITHFDLALRIRIP